MLFEVTISNLLSYGYGIFYFIEVGCTVQGVFVAVFVAALGPVIVDFSPDSQVNIIPTALAQSISG